MMAPAQPRERSGRLLAIGPALVLLASAAVQVAVGDTRAGDFGIGPERVPTSIIGSLSEVGAAILLVWRVRDRAAGIGLLGWAGAMGLLHLLSGGAPCDCLRGLGGHPLLVGAVWVAVAALGAWRTVRGIWQPGAAALVQLARIVHQPGI